MTTTNDLTAIEGIDINCSYEMICIDRLNTKVNAFDISGLSSQVATLTSQVNTLTTVSNNNRIIINVKDYGATGNGTTNDTTAILNAIVDIPTNAGVLYFPRGVYIVSNTLLIQNKNTFCIKSDNAVIINSNYNGSTLKLVSMNRVFLDGSLSINTPSSGLAISVGLELNQCWSSVFTDLFISGDFNIGLFVLQEGPRAGASPYGLSSIFNNIVVRGCRYGIYIGGEYYIFTNCYVCFNTIAGIFCDTGCGNNTIDSCHIIYNKLGIYVLGQNLTNSDHSKICNCIINHNSSCGIYLRNIEYTMQITNNQIWASYGSTMNNIAPIALPLSTTARSFSFGIYMENVVNVNIQGNTLSKSYVNIGLDGWSLCMISNNTFLLNPTNNIGHITEYGENNTKTGTANLVNTITNNMFNTDPASSVEYFSLFNSEKTRKYNIKGNMGVSTTNPLIIMNVGTYFISGNRDSYVINANLGLAYAPDNTLAGVALQATSITVLPSLVGQEFELTFYNVNQWVWIKFRINNTTTNMIVVGNGILQHDASVKAICINTRICSRVKFTPFGNEANQWIVSGYNAT